MKAIRFLTILFTTLSLYCVQTMVTPVYAGDDGPGSSSDFFSGGNGGDEVTIDGEKKGDDEAGMNMNMVLLFGVVLSGTILTMFCFDGKLDVKIFLGTAVMYVASEIMNYNSYKKQSEQEMKAYNTGTVEGDSAQKQSLYEAAGQTQAAADAAKKRGQAAKIAMSGFTAAAAIGYFMAFRDLGPRLPPPPAGTGLCTGGGTGGKDVLCNTDACAGGFAQNTIMDDYLTPDSKFESIANTNYGQFENYMSSADNDLNYLIRSLEGQRLSDGANSSMTIQESEEVAQLYPEKKNEFDFISAFKSLGTNIADLIMPVAQGNSLAALGLSGVAAYFVGKAVMNSKTVYGKAVKSGFTRATMYLAYAALALKVSMDADKAAEQLLGRAQQYKDLANKLGSQTLDTSNLNKIDTTFEIDGKNTMNPDISDAAPVGCFTGSKGQLNSDSKCQCKDANNCKKSEIPRIKMANVKLPSAITSTLKTVGDASNSLFSGDLEGGLANSNAAGKNAARLRKLNVGLRDKINKGIAAGGGKPINFDKLGKAMNKKLVRSLTSDLKNLSSKGKGALGGMFPGVFGDDAIKDPMKGIKVGDTNIKTGASGGLKSKSGSGSTSKDPLAGFTLEMDESEDVNYDNKESVAMFDTDSTGDQVETSSDDISGDRNKNIFSLISKRYFKTAYPTFFQSQK